MDAKSGVEEKVEEFGFGEVKTDLLSEKRGMVVEKFAVESAGLKRFATCALGRKIMTIRGKRYSR